MKILNGRRGEIEKYNWIKSLFNNKMIFGINKNLKLSYT